MIILTARRITYGVAPQPVIFGHAGPVFTGLVGWVSFLVTGSAVLAWLAIGFLGAGMALGISTVTVWTPYPARRGGAGPESPAGPRRDGPDSNRLGAKGAGEERAGDVKGGDRGAGSGAPGVPPGHAHRDDVPTGLVTDEMLARALSDEAVMTLGDEI